jgi:hypothetical protein
MARRTAQRRLAPDAPAGAHLAPGQTSAKSETGGHDGVKRVVMLPRSRWSRCREIRTLSLTSAGKVFRKSIPTQRYWEIYQDHVCRAQRFVSPARYSPCSRSASVQNDQAIEIFIG